MIKSPIVYIVDDDEAVRDSLSWLVESNGRASKAFASATEFIEAFNADVCSCLLLDVRMPEMNGLELQKELLNKGIDIPIIFISAHGTVPTAVRALKLGAVDFIMKPFNNVALLDKIEQALESDKARRVEKSAKLKIEKKIATLTPRERDVLELIVEGKPAKKIAAQLGISNKTVDVHRAHIMEKLEVRSVAALVRMVVNASNSNN